MKGLFKNLIIATMVMAHGCSCAIAQTVIKGTGANSVLVTTPATTVTAGGTTTLTATSKSVQEFTGSADQTVVLPSATTLSVGNFWKIVNAGTGTITVNTNGGALLKTILPSNASEFRAKTIATSAGTWIVSNLNNIGTVAQSSFFGSLKYTGVSNCAWTSTSTSYTNFAADTDCNAPVATGAASAPATKIPAIVFTNMPAGDYLFVATGYFYKASAIDTSVSFRISDGTSVSTGTTVYAGVNLINTTNVIGRFSYASAQSNMTFNIQGVTPNGSATVNIGAGSAGQTDLDIMVYYFPSSGTGTVAVNAGQLKAPTTTILTSGTSASYLVPTGVTHLEVEIVGGGGGGGSSASTGGNAGTAGGSTTFGTAVAGGGGGGAFTGSGGTGGTVTTAYSTVITQIGENGEGWFGSGTQQAYQHGGSGGASPMGGRGAGGSSSSVGFNGVTNSGSGGGGAGGPFLANGTSGSGGGSGGYIRTRIINPASSYTYTIGTAGVGGAAGTNGFKGGDGGSGVIKITEYYGWNMPVLLGGFVTSSTTGNERMERAIVNNNGTVCSVISQSGTWLGTPVRNGNGRCSFSISAGFSANPTCQCTAEVAGAGACVIDGALTISSSTISIRTSAAGAEADRVAHIFCMGPR